MGNLNEDNYPAFGGSTFYKDVLIVRKKVYTPNNIASNRMKQNLLGIKETFKNATLHSVTFCTT